MFLAGGCVRQSHSFREFTRRDAGKTSGELEFPRTVARLIAAQNFARTFRFSGQCQ